MLLLVGMNGLNVQFKFTEEFGKETPVKKQLLMETGNVCNVERKRSCPVRNKNNIALVANHFENNPHTQSSLKFM